MRLRWVAPFGAELERPTVPRPERPVKRVNLLGSNIPVTFRQTDAGLALTLPDGRGKQPASVYRIEI